MGCPALGCQEGHIGQLLMEDDIKYGPDGLSPILLIKVLRTVHKSRPLSIMLSVWIVIVIVHLQILK